MPFTPRNWLDIPTELDPLPDETVRDWHARILAYDIANPGALTQINAASLEDLETRVTDYTDESVDGLAATSYVDASVAGLAPVNSPALTGTPTAPTPSAGDNDTSIATTAYVQTEIAGLGGGGVTPLSWTALSFNTNWGDDSSVNFTGAWVKDDYGIVHLRGFVKRNAAGGSWSSDVIATLPAGAKPAKNVNWMALGEDHVGAKVGAWLSINRTTGDIQINGLLNFGSSPDYSGQAKAYLDNITFPTVA